MTSFGCKDGLSLPGRGKCTQGLQCNTSSNNLIPNTECVSSIVIRTCVHGCYSTEHVAVHMLINFIISGLLLKVHKSARKTL